MHTPLKTKQDVHRFFAYLLNDLELNFHPDTPFEDYINLESGQPSFTPEQQQQLNQRMDEAFKISNSEDGDEIYQIAIEEFNNYPKKHGGLQIGVEQEKFEMGGGIKKKLNWRLGKRFPRYYYGYNNGIIYVTQENNITDNLQIIDIELVFPLRGKYINIHSTKEGHALVDEMVSTFPELTKAEILEAIERADNFAKGGRIGFKNLAKQVAAQYKGKRVAPEYQHLYGKTYSAAEAQQVGEKVAAKIKRLKERKNGHFATGGNANNNDITYRYNHEAELPAPLHANLAKAQYGAPLYTFREAVTPDGSWYEVCTANDHVLANTLDATTATDALLHMAKGGNIFSFLQGKKRNLSRDRQFISQQEWEKNLDRKIPGKRYKAEGGSMGDTENKVKVLGFRGKARIIGTPNENNWHYTAIYELPDSDIAWTDIISAPDIQTARQYFHEFLPKAKLLHLNEALAFGGKMRKRNMPQPPKYANVYWDVQVKVPYSAKVKHVVIELGPKSDEIDLKNAIERMKAAGHRDLTEGLVLSVRNMGHEKPIFEVGGQLSPELSMAKADLLKLQEYAEKIPALVADTDNVEPWITSAISKVEQTVAAVKHTVEAAQPEMFADGGNLQADGENLNGMLRHIGKYATALLAALAKGLQLESWMLHELAIAGSSIDEVYHKLDYKKSK